MILIAYLRKYAAYLGCCPVDGLIHPSYQCTGLDVADKQKFQRKNVNIFLPINFSICFGCSKEPSH